MKRIILIAALITPTAGFAQQQSSPAEQALAAKLLKEIQEGVSCSADKIALQSALAKAEARIKELEKPAERPAK